MVSLAMKVGLESNFTVDVYTDKETNYEEIEKHIEVDRRESINFLIKALE